MHIPCNILIFSCKNKSPRRNIRVCIYSQWTIIWPHTGPLSQVQLFLRSLNLWPVPQTRSTICVAGRSTHRFTRPRIGFGYLWFSEVLVVPPHPPCCLYFRGLKAAYRGFGSRWVWRKDRSGTRAGRELGAVGGNHRQATSTVMIQFEKHQTHHTKNSRQT